MPIIRIEVTEEQHERLKAYARAQDRTLKAQVRRIFLSALSELPETFVRKTSNQSRPAQPPTNSASPTEFATEIVDDDFDSDDDTIGDEEHYARCSDADCNRCASIEVAREEASNWG
jgi:hypothetical protein